MRMKMTVEMEEVTINHLPLLVLVLVLLVLLQVSAFLFLFHGCHVFIYATVGESCESLCTNNSQVRTTRRMKRTGEQTEKKNILLKVEMDEIC